MPLLDQITTNINDGSLQYLNPAGTLIDVEKDGKKELIEVQGGPATTPETRTRVRAYRLQGGAYVDATDAIIGNVTLVAPSRTLVADFNGDGWNDVLVAGIGTDAPPYPGEQSQLLLNDQHGHLVNVTATHLPAHSGAYTHDATYGDIDGDGDLDLYMGNNTLNATPTGPRIYVNDGTGKFTDAPGRLPADIEVMIATYTGCLLLDVNGDGKADLILGGWPGGSGTSNEILLNNGSGTFVRTGAPAMPPKLFGSAGTVVLILPADLNGDGRTDLVLSTTDHYQHAALQIVLRQADGTFVDATASSGITWDPSVAEIDRSTTIADVNGDGKPDIVAHFYDTASYAFHTRIFLNRGDAVFVEATAVLPADPIGNAFHTGDVDGDGVIDFVSVATPWVHFLRGLKLLAPGLFPSAPVFTQQPAGRTITVGQAVTFTAAAVGLPAPTYQWRKDGVNITGATASSYAIPSATLASAGTYSVVATSSAGSVTSNAAVLSVVAAGADYNADGYSDILWENTTSGQRAFWLLNGTSQPSWLSLGQLPSAWRMAAVADLTGDGKPDIVWENTSTGDHYLWIMNGPAYVSGASLATLPLAWRVVGAGDFNSDGKADLVWENTSTGDRSVWYMDGTTNTGSASLGNVPVAWHLAAVADFNADTKPDLLWENTSTGDRAIWTMNGVTGTGSVSLGALPIQWRMIAAADFNADNKTDILWFNGTTGELGCWVMNGTSYSDWLGLGLLPLDWNLAPVCAGDFNADGKTDILWQNLTTGDRGLWLMHGAPFPLWVFIGTVPTVWHLAGSADLTDDGQRDLAWENTSTGDRVVWSLNGTTQTGTLSLVTLPPAWKMAAFADFNADGKPDILWQNSSTGDRVIWYMNGMTNTGSTGLGGIPVAWNIVAAADFNGDGKPDILWQNTTTGDIGIWLMDGANYLGWAGLGTIDPVWRMAGAADYNNDGQTDILWEHTVTGERGYWIMNGSTSTGWFQIGVVPPAWKSGN